MYSRIRPFKGNPVAVVFDGGSLSTERMQAIAHWTNLSETTFVCKPTQPQADYRLRIFTPRSELPFAGHPTIGSAHAVLRHGLMPKTAGRLVQECSKGLVQLQIDGDLRFLSVPPPAFEALSGGQLAALAAALGIETANVAANASVDVGIAWITLQLRHADLVRRLQPDQAKLEQSTPQNAVGVTVFGLETTGAATDLEVRSFAPKHGISEDPCAAAATVASPRSCSARGYWRSKRTSPRRAAASAATDASRSASHPTALSGSAVTR